MDFKTKKLPAAENLGHRTLKIGDADFRTWFANSKVVDERGEPRVVYHGTNRNFEEFKTGITSTRTIAFERIDVTSTGICFSPLEEDARAYGRLVKSCYLSIQKPLGNPFFDSGSGKSRLSQSEIESKIEELRYILEPVMGVASYHIGVEIPTIPVENGLYEVDVDASGEWVKSVFDGDAIHWGYLDNPDVVRRIAEMGYDGAKIYEFDDTAGYSWFALKPEQIRPACTDGGSGT